MNWAGYLPGDLAEAASRGTVTTRMAYQGGPAWDPLVAPRDATWSRMDGAEYNRAWGQTALATSTACTPFGATFGEAYAQVEDALRWARGGD